MKIKIVLFCIMLFIVPSLFSEELVMEELQEPMLCDECSSTTATRSCGQPMQVYQDQNGQIVYINQLTQYISKNLTYEGNYCLQSGVTLTTGQAGLTISANNVVLDLNGYTISGQLSSGTAITVAQNLDNVIIRNGTIKSIGGNGIQVSAGCSNLRIEDVQIISTNNNGIYIQGIQSCTISRCVSSSNTNYGIWFNRSTNYSNRNVFVNDCVCIGNGLDGLNFVSCFRASIADVISFGNSRNGFNESLSDTLVFLNCQANSNTVNGFNTTGNNFNFAQCEANGNKIGFSVSGNDQYIQSCIAQNNTNNGFSITGKYVNCESCDGSNNSNNGFSLTGDDQSIQNSTAQNNTKSGFYLNANNQIALENRAQNNTTGLYLDTKSNECQIRSNTLVANTVGLQNSTATINRIYGNFSSSNGTNFVGVPAASIIVSPNATTVLNYTANIDN